MTFEELPVHHALLITHHKRGEYAQSLWDELRSRSPAHRYFNQTVLDIETARTLISFAQSPLNVDKVALVSFHTASLPAQNALLKVLEEPRNKTRFILVTTNASHLIPTVVSRMRHVPIGKQTGDNSQAEAFLVADYSARMKLAFVVEMLAAVDEEGRKDRERVKEFILSLVQALKEQQGESRYITETLQIASYASDPSASGKALIEYLALLLPRFK